MKNAWLILSLIFLLQPVLPVLEYVVNYDYIVEVLCINKDKKELSCNGKCHLGKEVAKDFDNDNNSTNKNSTKKDFNQNLFVDQISKVDLNQTLGKVSKLLIPYILQKSNNPLIAINTPPPKF